MNHIALETSIIFALAKYLEQQGELESMRWMEALRHIALAGLPHDGWAHLQDASGHVQWETQRPDQTQHEAEPKDALELLKKRLKWQPSDDAMARRTGFFLAHVCSARR